MRIYYEGDLQTDTTICLDKAASQHVLRVMRTRVGEQFVVFNGQGGEYQVTLLANQQGVAELKIDAFDAVNREAAVAVHLGQGLSRGERMDYAIQKSVETGAASMTPLMTERCQMKLTADRLQKRLQHWHKVMLSACEQSGRTALMSIHPPCSLADWVSQAPGQKLLCGLGHSVSENPVITDSAVSLLIGPEGGLTSAEEASAIVAGFSPFSLGPRTLRTETAAPVATALFTIR